MVTAEHNTIHKTTGSVVCITHMLHVYQVCYGVGVGGCVKNVSSSASSLK